ncbi:MAG: G/U mismatch-specific DNA glycosylase [Actinomycetota bacterium]
MTTFTSFFPPWRPNREQLAAARGKTVPDVVGPGLEVLFCGINPGLYSGAVGHHFARPGNRFWKALQASGFTEELLSPFEEGRLLSYGLGITNLVGRATAGAEELSGEEIRQGVRRLERKVCRFRPSIVAVLGLGAYRVGFGRPGAPIGDQREAICASRVWLLPNPSGLNAHYRLAELTEAFAELRREVSRRRPPGPQPGSSPGGRERGRRRR